MSPEPSVLTTPPILLYHGPEILDRALESRSANQIEWPDVRSLTILNLREIEQSADRGPVVRLRTLSRYDAVEE